MEELPVELKEWLLIFCDDDSLALSIPRVSKLYNKLLEDNGAIWKAKCSILRKNEKNKLTDRSWKRFYFIDDLILFPLYGFTIGKSTYYELRAAPDAVEGITGNFRYITYRSVNFWFKSNIFNMTYTTRVNPLPTEWKDQGLHWNLSWVQVKELLQKKVGNYRVIKKPRSELFHTKRCFSARIDSILKLHNNDFYEAYFDFNYMSGDENTEGTLYSLSLTSADVAHKEEYYDRYMKGECNGDEEE